MAKRVLLAEDEPNIVASLTFLLERAGFAVASEINGEAALNQLDLLGSIFLGSAQRFPL